MPGAAESLFDPAREEAELREYLGASFDRGRLERYEEQLEAEFAEVGDEATFYRTSGAYLYNLTAFAMTATKQPYLAEICRRVRPPARVLDYGCGIGSDGLQLLAAGYRVEFADFDNPSVEYLRWRLARRGIQAPVHDLAAGVPAGFDVAFAFDVIEHVEDPFAFLGELERRARLVAVNFLEPVPGEMLHHELPVGRLVDHAAAHPLRFHGVLHGRSHLVIYETTAGTPLQRARNRTRLALGRHAARARRR